MADPFTMAAYQANSVPTTGLIGSEQALRGGMTSALGLLGAGVNVARQDLTSALQGARSDLAAYGDQAIRYANQGLQALEGAGGQASSALAAAGVRADEALNQAYQRGSSGIRGSIGQGIEALDPFRRTGLSGQQLQAALLGASGADAQAQAIAQFQDSPGQQWLREQGEQAVLRNQAAMGGLGSGRVLQELQRQGQGLASQQFDTRVGQLGQLGAQGLQAAGQIGGLRGQQASALAGLSGQLGTAGADIATRLGLSEASIGSDLARARGQLGAQIGGEIARYGHNVAGLGIGTGQNLANIAMQGAGQGAGIVGQFAPLVASGRSVAGQNLADIARGEASAIADQLGVTGSNLAGLLSGTGGQQATMMQNYAQLLANLATQQSGQVAGLPQVTYQAPNTLGQISQLAGGIGTLLSQFPSNGSNVPANTQPIAMVGTGQQFAGYA